MIVMRTIDFRFPVRVVRRYRFGSAIALPAKVCPVWHPEQKW